MNKQTISLLDEESVDILNLDLYWDFILELHIQKRYKEYRQGLEKLKKAGVNLDAYSLLDSIVYLFTRGPNKEEKLEILEMIRISIFECHILDIAYGEEGTIISYMKKDFFEAHGCIVDEDIINTIREYYYRYLISNYDEKKTHNFSIEQQHIYLLILIPEYEKVQKLLELGFKFDEQMFNIIDDVRYNQNEILVKIKDIGGIK